MLKLGQPLAIHAVPLVAELLVISHSAGFEHRAQTLGQPFRRRGEAIVNAQVKSQLVGRFVDDRKSILLPARRVRVAFADVEERDAIGARRVVAQQARRGRMPSVIA